MTQKDLIFDSGSLISLSINGLLEELKKLKKIFNGEFIITKEVKKEVVDNPIKIKMYELEALKIQNLIDEGCLNMPDKIGITDKEITFLIFFSFKILLKARQEVSPCC